METHPEYAEKMKEMEERIDPYKSRNDEIVRLRTEERLTLEAIAKRSGGITRERVRQVLKKRGIDPLPPKEKPKRNCVVCGVETETRKYCSDACFVSRLKFGKRRSEWTKEELKQFYRQVNYRPGAVEARHRYYENNRDKIKEKNRIAAKLKKPMWDAQKYDRRLKEITQKNITTGEAKDQTLDSVQGDNSSSSRE